MPPRLVKLVNLPVWSTSSTLKPSGVVLAVTQLELAVNKVPPSSSNVPSRTAIILSFSLPTTLTRLLIALSTRNLLTSTTRPSLPSSTTASWICPPTTPLSEEEVDSVPQPKSSSISSGLCPVITLLLHPSRF